LLLRRQRLRKREGGKHVGAREVWGRTAERGRECGREGGAGEGAVGERERESRPEREGENETLTGY
jgi:hypothetical protein